MNYKSYSDRKLVQESTLVCAYLCYLMEEGYINSLDSLIDFSCELDREIERRNLSNEEINRLINIESWSPYEQIVIGTFLFPESDLFNIITGKC